MADRRILTGQHFMNGDHACAEGALAAGCRFFAGYPITPSTEVAERLSLRMPEVEGVYIQMEDELASMAAILGASSAGLRSMTATSGPGFSLMMENIGLGVMMEIPCVVVNIQRGSPSTGLPTAPGQSDVMQARWGSHGDYEIVAYAPESPQEIFDLTVHCFNVADRYRTPALLMSDEVVGHMVERVIIPTLDEIPIWERKRPSKSPNGPFKPFEALDPDLVPPMAYAGEGHHIHISGLTHDERGYPDLTPENHHRLVTRLVNKINKNADDLIKTEEQYLDDARIVVISFGATARSARRAVVEARQEGIPAGFLRLISLWPFPESLIREIARDADAFVVAEMNLGQMAHEVQRHVSQPVEGVFHAGGAMMRPGPILETIREVSTSDNGRTR
ncbi:MAG: 2-oxoacid:acceptor oxidoreductase subunit alpha [Anaerolineae bacterium]|nr:MAG: 2-oxoacid:acceptor oxidoreductase subunit alpha [Anaerolineae bacterium]